MHRCWRSVRHWQRRQESFRDIANLRYVPHPPTLARLLYQVYTQLRDTRWNAAAQLLKLQSCPRLNSIVDLDIQNCMRLNSIALVEYKIVRAETLLSIFDLAAAPVCAGHSVARQRRSARGCLVHHSIGLAFALEPRL